MHPQTTRSSQTPNICTTLHIAPITVILNKKPLCLPCFKAVPLVNISQIKQLYGVSHDDLDYAKIRGIEQPNPYLKHLTMHLFDENEVKTRLTEMRGRNDEVKEVCRGLRAEMEAA